MNNSINHGGVLHRGSIPGFRGIPGFRDSGIPDSGIPGDSGIRDSLDSAPRDSGRDSAATSQQQVDMTDMTWPVLL
jgi:hypothetical protein